MSSPKSATDEETRSKPVEQITFRFCSECSNMLYPKQDDNSHRLQFTCRTCHYTEEAQSSCVFRNVMNNAAGETAGVTQDVGSDPTADAGLPPNWEVRHSNSKNLPYYFNTTDKVSRWEPPPGTDTEKLKHYMATHHSASTSRPADGPVPDGKIRAAHLLVKHEGSRRPSSWRQEKIDRTKEDAYGIIRGYEEKIKNGQSSLGDLAVTESDCSSARKRGDLGYFGQGDMQREFEEAAFALKVGEVSGIIETASGLHLIERLE
ncbi:hypothetical protein ACHAQH_006392 [Verticillium albo-atrum]